MEDNQDLIFALDIGTRTVVGVIFKQQEDKLIVKESEIIEHKQRSMLDGQIHNVSEVTAQVTEIKARLEERMDIELNKVAIAAAGRALKTLKGSFELQFKNNKEITEEDVKTLEFTAVQKAQEKLAAESDRKSAAGYHFVGYSVIRNRLDGIEIADLIDQRGSEIEVEVVATFLPRVVVDSLLTVIRQAGLEVEHLTLEPIAASNLLIPQQMHGFNLALVDIGAGTSDIAVTEEGTIIGYDMVPVAGDEITEVICDTYMLDYHSAEEIKRGLADQKKFRIKDILDQDVELPAQEALEEIEPKVEELAALIGERIIGLNQAPPQAVICFGGGSLSPLLKEKLAQALELPSNRIGIKNQQDSNWLEGEVDGLTITQAITPLGIGLSTYLNPNQANFLDVTVNDDLIHLFTLTEPEVSDALLAAEIDFKELEPGLGLALTVEVNDEFKVIPGKPGTAGEIRLNGKEVELDAPISNGDEIEVDFGEKGQAGKGTIADVVPSLESKEITANGRQVELVPRYYLDGESAVLETPLHDRAEVTYREVRTVGEAIEEIWNVDLVDLKERIIEYEVNGEQRKKRYSNYYAELNGSQVSLDTEIQSGDELFFEELDQTVDEKLTVDKALGGMDTASTLEITINNRELEIPDAGFRLLKNGTETTLDAEVKTGDEIIYQSGEMNIREVLDYINYKLSDDDLDKVEIKKNGTTVSLQTQVDDGDQISIFLSRLS